jgi:hypothetical protein
MLEIWKNRDICFMDTERVYEEWMERKVTILNSRILENFNKLFEGKFQRRY